MFDVSMGEIFLVMLVAIAVTNPKDYPKIIARVRKFYSNVNAWKTSVTGGFNQLADEFEIDEIAGGLNRDAKQINEHMRQVIDVEGNIREAYDVRELEKIKRFNGKLFNEPENTTIQ